MAGEGPDELCEVTWLSISYWVSRSEIQGTFIGNQGVFGAA